MILSSLLSLIGLWYWFYMDMDINILFWFCLFGFCLRLRWMFCVCFTLPPYRTHFYAPLPFVRIFVFVSFSFYVYRLRAPFTVPRAFTRSLPLPAFLRVWFARCVIFIAFAFAFLLVAFGYCYYCVFVFVGCWFGYPRLPTTIRLRLRLVWLRCRYHTPLPTRSVPVRLRTRCLYGFTLRLLRCYVGLLHHVLYYFVPLPLYALLRLPFTLRVVVLLLLLAFAV